MATTLKITITTTSKETIEGLKVQAYSIKGRIGRAKKTDNNGKVSLEVSRGKIEDATVFLKVYDGKQLIKTTEKLTEKELKGADKYIRIDANKLSLLLLPKKEKLHKELNKELQTRLTNYLYGRIATQLKDPKKSDLKVIKDNISKHVEKENFKKYKRLLSAVLKETISDLKSNANTNALMKKVVIPEKKEKQTLGSFLRLGEPINKNSWFKDQLKANAFDKAAELPFVETTKKDDFKTILAKSLTKDGIVKELIEGKIVTKANKNKLELWLDAGPVLGDNHQLMKNILNDNTIKTVRDLVMIRSIPQKERGITINWKDLIEKNDDLPINGNEEDYIKILEDRIAARYPYAFMMDRLVEDDFVGKNKHWDKTYKYLATDIENQSFDKVKLAKFFNDFPDIDLRKVDLLKTTFSYKNKKHTWKKRDKKTNKITDPIQKHLLAMQRIFSVVPTYSIAEGMLKAGFYSAADVSQVPMKELKRRLNVAGMNIDAAKQSIRRVKARAERSTSQVVHMIGNMHALSFNQFATLNVDVTQPLFKLWQKELADIPGYEDHFGPQNYCKCAHCQSIYSPGAYFVDLMQYIKWAVEYHGNDTTLHLKTRRKDLWKIAINCENAHKEIPYLEVVNEVLEKYIEAELLPHGAEVIKAVSTTSRDRYNNFSFLQPINLVFEKLKVILGHFNLTLFDLSALSHTGFSEKKSRHYFGITTEEWAVITNSTLENKNRYGELLEGDEIKVADFLQKTKLTRTELKYLLKTQYIKGKDFLRREVEPVENEVNKLTESITGFSKDVADRFFRFVRLWKLLPWTIQELDLALNTKLIIDLYEKYKNNILLNKNNPPKDHLFSESLQEVAKMAFIQQQLDISVEELVGIISGIPTKKGVQINTFTQQYTNLEFEQPAPSLLYRIFKPIQDDLKIKEEMIAADLVDKINTYFEGFYHPVLDTEEEKQPVSEKAASLLGILKISEADFALLLAEFIERNLGEINDKITEGKINLELPLINLLYRYVKIADGLGVSISELISLVHLVLGNQKITSIDEVIQLVQEYAVIEELPFSIEELAFIIKGEKSNQVEFLIAEESIKAATEQLKEELLPHTLQVGDFTALFFEETALVSTGFLEKAIINLFYFLKEDEYVFAHEENNYSSLKEIDGASLSTLLDGLTPNDYVIPEPKSIEEKRLEENLGRFMEQLKESLRMEIFKIIESKIADNQQNLADVIVEKVKAALNKPNIIGLNQKCKNIVDKDILDGIINQLEFIIKLNELDDIIDDLENNDFPDSPKEFIIQVEGIINQEKETETIQEIKNGIKTYIIDKLKSKKEEIEQLITSKQSPFVLYLSKLFETTYDNIINGFFCLEGKNLFKYSWAEQYGLDVLNGIEEVDDDLRLIIDKLQKILFVFEKSGLSTDQVRYVIKNHAIFNLSKRSNAYGNRIYHLKTLDTIQRLQEYKKWIDLTKDTTYELNDWLTNFVQLDEDQNRQIADVLEISPQQFIEIKDKLLTSPITIDKFQQLRKIAEKVSLLGMSIADFKLLTEDGYDNIKRANKAILNAFKSKYKTEVDWEEAYEPYQEKLQEIKRDILVDYILNWRNHPRNRDRNYYKFKNTNDLYHYFLLDPEMSGCAQISKLKAATLSLQLYVQRVFLQLEKSADGIFHAQMDETLARQWVWRKNYRIWEANRKVFLYPENYIEPEWRDNKSPQFEKLEEELMQEEINADSVELAYKLYLNQFVEVANLTIAGQYYDDRPGKGIYYFFGRTVTEPYLYYYRKYIPKTETRAEEWTAWERIDLPINSKWVSALHIHGKVYLFWVQLILKKNENEVEYTEFGGIFNSYQDSNGNWSKETKITITPSNSSSDNLPTYVEAASRIGERVGVFNYHPKIYHLAKISFKKNNPYQFAPSVIVNFSLKKGVLMLPATTNFDIYFNQLNQGVSQSFHDPFLFICDKEIKIREFVLMDFLKNEGVNLSTYHQKYFSIKQIETNNISNENISGTKTGSIVGRNIDLRIFPNSSSRILKIENQHYFFRFEIKNNLVFTQNDNSDKLQFFEDRIDMTNTNYVSSTLNIENVSRWGNNHPYQRKAFEFLPLRQPITVEIQPIYTAVSTQLEKRLYNNQLKKFLSAQTQIDTIEPESKLAIEGDSSFLKKKNISPPKNHLYYKGSYGIYFKELFFHIPFLIANHLNANQKFKEAKWWYERIFNPTATAEGGTQGTEHFWEFLPFRNVAKEGVTSLKSILQNTQAIGAYEEEPFMPHMIARVRTDAYMKTIVMKYIDNLLDWGDYLFSRDSFESINEAMMLYILAQDILGDKPVELGECENVTIRNYEQIEKELEEGKEDDFLIYLENSLPSDEESTSTESVGLSEEEIDQSPTTDIAQHLPLFCVPFNKEMIAYWSRVEDRLFKIRNCMNIKGQKRKLSLYEPPIDPRLLVAARASGLSLEDAIASVLGAGNLPHYRFNTILSKARDFVGTVQNFGSALLSAVEKKDVEQLTLLRSTHEQNILKLTKLIKKSQIEEAQTQLINLQETKANIQLRVDYYQALIDEGLTSAEKKQQKSAHIGNILKTVAGVADIVPTVAHGFPKAFSTTGADEVAKVAEAIANVLHTSSSIAHAISSSAGIVAGNNRRKQEWKQQLKVAKQELKQLDQQILAAEIRIKINEQDFVVYEQQVEQAKELHDFYKNKLTKLGLYNYHATTLGRLFRHAYNMALDMAKQAERCYQFEVDDPTNYIIQNDNWDSSHYGFLAGERLLFQLQQLDKAYLEKNERRQEITQSFSLRQLDAEALLRLKANGDSGGFTIPEWVFDMFYPGHYKRIIKSVRLTIPCVTGPYTNVPATLTLNSSQIRLKADWENAPTGRSYGKMQSISTSSANNDGGLFEFNFRDERYLPFEGAGAVNSSWALSLPSAYKPFDYNTISDVIIHISYTAKFDSVPVGVAFNKIKEGIDGNVGTKPLLISLQHDFPNEYTQLKNGKDEVTLTIGQTHFPYFTMGKTITINRISRLDAGNNLVDFKPVANISPISNDIPEVKIAITNKEWTDAEEAVFLLLEYTLTK